MNLDSPETSTTRLQQIHHMGSDEVIASLLDLRQGNDSRAGYSKGLLEPAMGSKTIEGITLSGVRIVELFKLFGPPNSYMSILSSIVRLICIMTTQVLHLLSPLFPIAGPVQVSRPLLRFFSAAFLGRFIYS